MVASGFRSGDTDFHESHEALRRVSRSFLFVIAGLPASIRRDVEIMYLVMQAMDVVEDDTILASSRKVEWLAQYARLWSDGGGAEPSSLPRVQVARGKDTILLDRLDAIWRVFRSLARNRRRIIATACDGVAQGMIEFVRAGSCTPTYADYEAYCEAIGGSTGEGLSRIFADCDAESADLASPLRISQVRALAKLIQKADLIEDFAEDLDAGRSFSPVEVTRGAQHSGAAVRALCLDAVAHVSPAMEYIASLDSRGVRSFVGGITIGALVKIEAVARDPDAVLRAKPHTSAMTKAGVLLLTALAPKRQVLDAPRRLRDRILKDLSAPAPMPIS